MSPNTTRTQTEELPAGVAAALAAAEIPHSKLGAARRARLSEQERTLYFRILRRFASGGRPSMVETRAETEHVGLDLERAFATLTREDLVHFDGAGEITVAYPFSGRRTAHLARFPGGQETYAMCAIDALGIAAMFDEPITIESRDPFSGAEIHARIAPDGEDRWRPQSAVVVAGVLDRQADSCDGCCPVLNFFASSETALRWLEAHPEVRGHAVSMPEAIAAGRAVFANALGA
jgi:alkylmercury lyase-like protein